MKKIGVLALCLAPLLLIAGCGGSISRQNAVIENMSEKSEVYFTTEGDISASICSGQREDEYGYDGISHKKLDFALLVADLDSACDEMISLKINDVESQVLLEYDYRTGKHMADLQKKLSGEEKISLTYMNHNVNFVNKSSEFGVDSAKAISIGTEALGEFIDSLIDGKNFAGECYLKIMDDVSDDTNEVYWLFSVCSKSGEMKNVAISTKDGFLLADGSESMI